MRLRLTGLFLLLSLGIGIVPNGLCPGCVTPYCLFKSAPQNVACSCCAAKAPASHTSTQMKDGNKCCFVLPLVVHSAASAPAFAIVDHDPELQPVSIDGSPSQSGPSSELRLTGPPGSKLFLTHRSFLI